MSPHLAQTLVHVKDLGGRAADNAALRAWCCTQRSCAVHKQASRRWTRMKAPDAERCAPVGGAPVPGCSQNVVFRSLHRWLRQVKTPWQQVHYAQELSGPLSMQALEEDVHLRQAHGYLPKADQEHTLSLCL